MYYTIYQTTNLINGKKYIGMHETDNLNDGYLGSGIALTAAINKYGKDNFLKEIVYYAKNKEEMIKKEKELITEEIALSNDYYNLRIGGHGGKLTEEIKQKIGKKSKQWWEKKTPEERTQHVRYMQKNYTIEQRRELTLGRNNGMYGKTHSDKTKELLKEKSAKKDHTVLKWEHESGELFIGTMTDFYKKYNLCRAWVSRVRRGIKNTIKGWKFVEELYTPE